MQKYTFSQASEAQELIDKLAGRHLGEQNVEGEVREILEAVKIKKDSFLIEKIRAFDCREFNNPLRLSESEIQQGAAQVSPEDMEIIAEAARNIRSFHEAQLEKSWFQTREDGTILGQKISPVRRAGLYVPGGKGGNTPLISSLLMQAIPAQVAGVKEIAVTSPPRENGTLNPYLLAAAYLLDITEVYRVGGPWAVGALAYGTESIIAVDVITGPGNQYVTMAKKMVQGQVGIDMLAGPSEILVLADDSANPEYVAADLLSQAEHDSLASAVCVTTSPYLADKILESVEKRLADLPRADIARESVENFGAVIIVPTMQTGIEIANRIAPEHMELMVQEPWNYVPHINTAGALFLGAWSPEPVGDYFAGPNHVLPTQGTARYASALGVQTFCKKTSIISASMKFTRAKASSIAKLARMEGLEAHAKSVEMRK